MKDKGKVVFVGLDASKARLAVSVADNGRDGEIRDWGTISTAPSSVDRFLKKLAARFDRVEICYEAGPTGYGLYRQITAFGFTCYVIAPSLIPMRAGERVKTDRRDAERLARLLRAGELTPIWVPDETHEAMRDFGAGTRQRGPGSTPQATADLGVSSATWSDLPPPKKLDDALSALVAATIL